MNEADRDHIKRVAFNTAAAGIRFTSGYIVTYAAAGKRISTVMDCLDQMVRERQLRQGPDGKYELGPAALPAHPAA